MILLIEDDLVTCHIMTALLKRLRHPHVVAHNGAEAIEHVSKHPIDLMIADLMLPDINGLDLIEQILVRPHLQDIPVMFCTANADPKTASSRSGVITARVDPRCSVGGRVVQVSGSGHVRPRRPWSRNGRLRPAEG